jgi:steroid delta-isomerase
MISPERVQAVVDAYVDAYRRNDKDACVALFATDAQWHDPVGEPPHVGHAGVRAFWDQARTLADAIVLVPSNVIVCANQAVMVFEIEATIDGGDGSTIDGGDGSTIDGGDGSTSTMVMDAVEVFVLDDDGLIVELRAYWDMTRAHTRA